MRKAIEAYIESDILPLYDAFDKGHNRAHVRIVMANCAELAVEYGADQEMLYAIAAYHDIGLRDGRDTHHIVSAKLLLEDGKLREWFAPGQLCVMAEAIEDHRASSTTEPRSLYGAIIADADRELDIDRLLYRTLMYGLEHYPEYAKAEQLERAYRHIQGKFGEGGYMRFHLPASDANRRRQTQIFQLIADRPRFDECAGMVYDGLRDNRQ